MKNKKLLIIIIILLLLIGVATFLVIRNNNEKEPNIMELPDVNTISITDYKSYDDGQLLLIGDISLDSPLPEGKTIQISFYAKDEDDKVIGNYLKDLSAYNLEDNTEIGMGFYISMSSSELDLVDSVVGTVQIIDRKNMSNYFDYSVCTLTQYEIVPDSSFYRVFLDIDESYTQYGGIGVMEYSNGDSKAKYLSYLDSINFRGIFSMTDPSTYNGGTLERIKVYRGAALLEI